MLEKALEVLKKYAAGKKTAVAVSGGRDSMCLLDIVLSAPFLNKSDVIVVNVEHGIRGASSERDSEFVKEYCKERGVEFLGFKADVPSRRKLSGNGEEQEARQARREIFRSVLDSGKADIVALAHHRADNAETVLLNALRGSGLGGVVGMREFSDGILRPLLSVGRAEIDEYVEKHALPFVEDETNADTGYTRNFIRRQVMPLLSLRFDAESALLRLASSAAADDGFIRSQMAENAVQKGNGAVRIKAEYLKAHRALAVRYAVQMLREFTFDYDVCGIDSLIDTAYLRNGAKREIRGGLVSVSEYGFVTLYKPGEKCALSCGGESAESFPFKCGEYRVGDLLARVKKTEPKAIKRGGGRTLVLDADKIPSGAVVRLRKAGDRFEPFGGGKRKLKEYFIDKKIPRFLRGRLPLVCDGSEVLAVFGAEISRSVALDDKSENACELSLEGDAFWKG